MKVKQTNDGKNGGLLKGKPHYDKDGNSLGGIKAVVSDSGNRPVELEGGEVIINKEASKKHWKLLSKINQSAGGGVPIGPPSGAEFDEDPEEFKEGGRIIEFNPNHVPNKWVVQYAEKIKKEKPEIWKLGGNIFGNQAFENLLRVSKRGHWLDSEEWMYIKWRSYIARHKGDFRIEGVVAMLKWCDKVEKGWAYMKDLIEEKIDKIESKKEKAETKMKTGGKLAERYDGLNEEKYSIANKLDNLSPLDSTYDSLKNRLNKIIQQIEKIEKSNEKMATGGGVETKKIKWKPSKNEKVEGFVSKSFPYSGKGDMLLTKAEFVKKWSPRIESWIGIKPNLSNIQTFFPDYSMDFKFTGSDGNSYRIYSPGESAKSKQYIIQKLKANVQMATGGGVESDEEVIKKLEKKFKGKNLWEDEILDEYEVKMFDYTEEADIDEWKDEMSNNFYVVEYDNSDDSYYFILVPKNKMATGGGVLGSNFDIIIDNKPLIQIFKDDFLETYNVFYYLKEEKIPNELQIILKGKKSLSPQEASIVYQELLKSNKIGKTFNVEVSEYGKGGGIEIKKIKWKPSKNEKVEGFVSKSFPYSGKGDMLLTKAEFVKKWSPRIESWIGIKPNLSNIESFFPNYTMDFKFTASDGNSYRIYSPGESAKSKQYIIQKLKANVQMATGGGVDNYLEINQILKRLESAYLTGRRDLLLIRDKDQIQNPIYTKEMWEKEVGIEGELYQWLKKYDIIGEITQIYINNLEEVNEWKSKIKELKSNGYLVVTQVSAPSKNRVKRYRYIAIKQKFSKGGGIDNIEPEGYKKQDAIKYGKKLVDANLKYIEIRNKIEENYAGLRSEIQDVLNSVLDYYEKKPLKQNLLQEDKIAPGRINELSATLLNQIKRYAKENYNEDVLDDTFMLKGEEIDGDFQVEEVSIDTVSGRDIHITIEKLFMKRGGELSKGIRAELEHKKTIDKIYNRKVSISKAPELIAKDHLKEDPKYYSKLEQIEGKKFATGSSIEKFDIGDRVYLNTKKGKIEVIVTKYSNKWVQVNDLTKGKDGRWIATPEFHEQFDSFVNQPTTTTQTPTTQSTQTTNGFKVGDILEWKEDLQPLYNAKKGDKAKVIEIATEGEEYDIYVEWISATTQENGWYLSSMFVKAKNQVLPKSPAQQSPEEDDEEEPTLVTPEDMDKILEQLRNPKKPPNPFTRVLLIPKKEPKIKEPEPVKRKFKQEADYLKIFTEYFEKDTEMGRPVKSESYTKAIVNNFIIATEDIGGFSKDKLKEIKSFIDKE